MSSWLQGPVNPGSADRYRCRHDHLTAEQTALAAPCQDSALAPLTKAGSARPRACRPGRPCPDRSGRAVAGRTAPNPRRGVQRGRRHPGQRRAWRSRDVANRLAGGGPFPIDIDRLFAADAAESRPPGLRRLVRRVRLKPSRPGPGRRRRGPIPRPCWPNAPPFARFRPAPPISASPRGDGEWRFPRASCETAEAGLRKSCERQNQLSSASGPMNDVEFVSSPAL